MLTVGCVKREVSDPPKEISIMQPQEVNAPEIYFLFHFIQLVAEYVVLIIVLS